MFWIISLPPPRPGFRRSSDEQLGIGLRCNHSPNVTPIEHRAAGLVREILLPLQKCCANRGVDRGTGGVSPSGLGAEFRIKQQRLIKLTGIERVIRHIRIAPGAHRGNAHGAVEQPSIEVRQMEARGQSTSDCPFARSRRAINRDDYHRINTISSPSTSTRAHSLSAVSTGTPLLIAKLIQLRSPIPRPYRLVVA